GQETYGRCPSLHPGVGIGSERAYPLRELPGGDLGHRDEFEDLAFTGPQRDPNLLKGRRRAVIAQVLRPLAADVGQRAVDDPDDLGERDLRGRAGQPVTTLRTPLGVDDTRASQLQQDALQKLRWNLLSRGKSLRGHR